MDDRDLSRCSWCGRRGTLTCLSAGNTCVFQDECEAERKEVFERAARLTLNASDKKDAE